MLRRCIVAATGIALGLGVNGADGAPARVDPVLAFCGDCRGYEPGGLFTMRPDGTRFRLFLQEGRNARWAPDGSRLAVEGDGALAGIWTMRADGGGRRQLSSSRGDDAPAWSPDGRKIVYVHSRHTMQLWVMAARGGGKHALMPRKIGDEQSPDWSPRGDRIAFNVSPFYGNANGGLYLVKANGTGVRRLRVEGEIPRWSPDGLRLAYLVSGAGDYWQVNVLTLRTNRVRSYRVRLNGSALVWSPDAKSLLVSAWLPDPLGYSGEHVARLRLRDGHLTLLQPGRQAGNPIAVDWRR